MFDQICNLTHTPAKQTLTKLFSAKKQAKARQPKSGNGPCYSTNSVSVRMHGLQKIKKLRLRPGQMHLPRSAAASVHSRGTRWCSQLPVVQATGRRLRSPPYDLLGPRQATLTSCLAVFPPPDVQASGLELRIPPTYLNLAVFPRPSAQALVRGYAAHQAVGVPNSRRASNWEEVTQPNLIT